MPTHVNMKLAEKSSPWAQEP